MDNWFDIEKTSEVIRDFYKVEPIIYEVKIDSNNYKNYISIFSIFIKILILLFVLLLLISIVNVIVDEKKNNVLYYSLEYSKLMIFNITFNKILLLLLIPLCILLLSLMIGL